MSDSKDGESSVEASNDGTAALGEDHTTDADEAITDGNLGADADLTAGTDK